MIYSLKKVSFAYNPSKNILNDIDLKINDGELITLLGKNGSGKSTLFSLLTGINKKYAGSILLNDKEIKDLKEKEIASLVGFVAQSNEIAFGFTVFEYCLMGLASKIGIFSSPSKSDEDKVIEVLKLLDLDKFKDRDYSELSGGERQQVVIARALVSDPKILIFDEPFAHLDYSNQIKVLKTIKELHKKGYTILVSTHDPNHALMLESSVILLDENGHIEKGKCLKMLNEEKLKSIYKCDLKIKYIDDLKCYVCIFNI